MKEKLFDILKDRDHFPLLLPFTNMEAFFYHLPVFYRGEGIYIYDLNDNKYIDAAGGLWNVSCGLGNKKILDAMQEQMQQMVFGSIFRRSNAVAVELAARLVEISRPGLTRVCLTCSGSASIEAAIMMIRSYFSLTGQPDKKGIVCLKKGYHGTYYGSGTASDVLDGKEHFEPAVAEMFHIEPPYCYRCPLGQEYPGCGIQCADELAKLAGQKKGRLAAFMMEPIPGSGGIIVPPKEYFKRIQTICKEHELFLILDEVATGFGRTGAMFAAELFDIEPDVMTLSKGINSGYLPLGAALFCEEIYRPYKEKNMPLQIGTTQDGNPVCCAASLATIELLTRGGLIDNCKKMGRRLKQACMEMKEKSLHIGDVRGEGLMIGIELVKNKEKKTPVESRHIGLVCDFLKDNGLIVYPNPCGISLFPALTVTEEQTHRIIEILGKILLHLNLEV
jgi:adenosylmethionine-8-amino-7-oxononanoate aminotransferase